MFISVPLRSMRFIYADLVVISSWPVCTSVMHLMQTKEAVWFIGGSRQKQSRSRRSRLYSS
jgi:hypothetical protein